MKGSVAKPVLLLMGIVMTSACSSQKAPFDGMVPAGAASVSYAQQSEKGYGVTFHLNSLPNSYEYVDDIREKLQNSGYELCKKSAISKWEPQPADFRHGGSTGFWLVELYAAENFSNFFIVRVVALPAADGSRWRQEFSLASQKIPEGRQNMPSIKDFCD